MRLSANVATEQDETIQVTLSRGDGGIGLQEQLTVDLKASVSNNRIEIPATVTFPPGQGTVNLTVQTIDNNLLDGNSKIELFATSVGFLSQSQELEITDFERLQLTALTGSAVENSGKIEIAVRRNTDAIDEPLTITVTPNIAGQFNFPESVTIPAGESQAVLSATPIDDQVLEGTQQILFNFSAPGYIVAQVQVELIDFEDLSLTLAAQQITEAQGEFTGTIVREVSNLNLPLVVRLFSSDSSELIMDESVTIPADQKSATFRVRAVDDDLLDGRQTVQLSARAAGYEDAEISVNVNDFESLSLIVDNSQLIEAGAAQLVTLTRSNLDNQLPLLVHLNGSDPSELSMPRSVVIPAGQSSVTFLAEPVDDSELDGTQSVTLIASNEQYFSSTIVLMVLDDDRRYRWHNYSQPLDVNLDDRISPADALLVINYLNSTFDRFLPNVQPDSSPKLDVDANDRISPSDALLIINYLNSGSSAESEATVMQSFDSYLMELDLRRRSLGRQNR